MGKIYHLFCDESRQCVERYMVIGGVIVTENSIPAINKAIRRYREQEKMYSELKWGRVSNKFLKKYLRFVDYFFALNEADKIHFHCLIVDNSLLDHKKFSGGSFEVGFYKLFYQLILHCFGRKYCINDSGIKFVIHLDERSSNYDLNNLLRILNAGIRKEYNLNYSPFVKIEANDSRKTELIQIADIILGAVGYEKNGIHLLPDRTEAKKELCRYFAKKAGLSNLTDSTPIYIKRFNIWNFRLK